MSEESVSKEIKNCVSNVELSGSAALASHDINAFFHPRTTESVDQAAFSILRETERKPCNSLIRALDPQLRLENLRLRTATSAIASLVPSPVYDPTRKGRPGKWVAVLSSVAQLHDEERRKAKGDFVAYTEERRKEDKIKIEEMQRIEEKRHNRVGSSAELSEQGGKFIARMEETGRTAQLIMQMPAASQRTGTAPPFLPPEMSGALEREIRWGEFGPFVGVLVLNLFLTWCKGKPDKSAAAKKVGDTLDARHRAAMQAALASAMLPRYRL